MEHVYDACEIQAATSSHTENSCEDCDDCEILYNRQAATSSHIENSCQDYDDCEILYNRQEANFVGFQYIANQEVPKDNSTVNTVTEEEWQNGGLEAIANVLLNYVETCSNVFDDQSIPSNLEKGYAEFKSKLQKESGTDVDLLFTGSHAHNLLAFHWVYPPVTTRQMGRRALTDIDVLLVDKSHTVGDTERWLRHNYIMKSTSHPGYVNLYKGTKKISSKGFRKYWKTMIDKVEIHARGGRGTSFPARGKLTSGPALTRVDNISDRNFYDHDFVPALKCVTWPEIASDWESREMKSGWPSADLIRQCLDSDCYIVSVGNKLSSRYTKGNEWRLSFSGAAIKLAKSYSLHQRQAAILSKLLIKEVTCKLTKREPRLKNVKLISSHEIQTSILWLMEEKKEWDDLFADCKDIIVKLLYFLSEKYLPDYFIPKRNIIETMAFHSIEIFSQAIRTHLLEGNLIDVLHGCFQTCYSGILDYDLPEAPLLKTVMGEIDSFRDLGTPSCRLYIICIIYVVLNSLSAVILNAIHEGDGGRIDIVPLYTLAKKLQGILLTKLNTRSFFDLDYLKQIYENEDRVQNASDGIKISLIQPTSVSESHLTDDERSDQSEESEYFPTFAVLCEEFTDDILGALSQEFVIDLLHVESWAVVVYFMGEICLPSGVYYSMNQEVIDLELMLEANKDNHSFFNAMIQPYGTMSALRETTAKLKEKIDEDFSIYVACAQSALCLYFHLCEHFKLENVPDFSCRSEKIAVSLAKTFQREIPEIFEDEYIGTPVLKERVLRLFKENVKDLVFTVG